MRPMRRGGGGKVSVVASVFSSLPLSALPSLSFSLCFLSFLSRLCLVFYSVACVEEGIVSSQHPPAPYPDISARRSALSPSP